MRSFSLRLALGVTAVACFIGTAHGQVIQLRSGTVLVGKVDAADESGLTFQRLDNGGMLDLRWEQLSGESAGKIKALYNLADDEEGEVMVTANVITFESAGGQREQVTGRVVSETNTEIVLRRRGLTYPIPRRSIKRRTTTEVPATDVYTVDQFYNEKLGEFAPGDDADKHIQLADILVRARDYANAGKHLERAKELGGGRQQNTLEGRIERLQRFSEAHAERALLDEIRVMMARKQFQKGLQKIEEFQQTYPETKLATEFAATVKRFHKTRDHYLVNRVASLWYKNIWSLARTEAVKADMTFTSAKDYAESQMGQDIRDRIMKSLGIEEDELQALWDKRLKIRGGPRPEQYHYGLGSWTLGPDQITKDTNQGKSEKGDEKKKSKKDKEMERIIKRIRKAQERARRALSRRGGKGGSGAEEELTPEDWWDKKATANEKIGWLRAYYAEHGGDLHVERAYNDNCVGCAGAGTTTEFGDSGEMKKVKCSTCQGTRFKRWFRAR